MQDVTCQHCQRRTGVRVRSLHRVDPEPGCWQELVVEDRRASLAEVAATRNDFREWSGFLSRNKRQIAELLANGETTQAVARQLKLSSGRSSQLRRELQTSWDEFQGQCIPIAA